MIASAAADAANIQNPRPALVFRSTSVNPLASFGDEMCAI